MNQLNNMENFDSLFSNAAAEYELAFDQNAWHLMQQKLDTANTKKRFGFWWWLFTIGFLSLIISFFTTNIFHYTLPKTPIKKQIITSQNITDENTKKPDNKKNDDVKNIDDNISKNNFNQKENISTTKQENFTSIHREISLKNQDNKTTKLSSKQIKQNSKNIDIATKINDFNSDITNTNKINKSSSIINSKTSKNNIDDEVSKIMNDQNSSTPHLYTPSITYLHNRYISNFKQLESENIIIAKKREEEHKKLVEEENKPMFIHRIPYNQPTNRWFLNTSLANNIPYVSNPQIKNSSIQFQFGIGYNISKNTSIQTGVSFGIRNFDMRKDQFSYKGPGAFEKNIRNINADISLIEIPITLKYQLSSNENFAWFGTFGISSLFFTKENYLLTIDDGSTIQYLPQNFSNTKSILSMLNLSIGYQFPVSRNTSICAEPYIQLPFKSIGEGGSKISSIGIQLGAKYQFTKKKK